MSTHVPSPETYIMKLKALLITILYSAFVYGQDLSEGLSAVNDTGNYPMQDKLKPAYLDTIIDPSFGTTIRRITDAGSGGAIVPLVSTVQPWNADESLLIVYDQRNGVHQLLHGQHYYFIRNLYDIQPNDIEELFWDFDKPSILYYLDKASKDFIRYNVVHQSKEVLVNLKTISNCGGEIDMGNNIQMMSWDSDVLGFKCGYKAIYSYRISTGELTPIGVPTDDIRDAPMPGPSGNRFYHRTEVYDTDGNFSLTLNEWAGENGSLGKLPNGDDARFAVTFADGPNGGCGGNIIAYNMVTGECFEVISQGQGYPYSKSGTNISAVAHKNTEGGWIAASMMGYDRDGQSLLDQEIVIAKADQDDIKVCRIAHHRSDRDDFSPWGAPYATISPTGTRVLFASDWSGAEDGQSVDCYVVELPVYEPPSKVTQSDPFVYPGDCNMDGQVSADDAIYINLALGNTLPPRPNANTDWIPQIAYDSGDSIQGIDLKYIDADGNGLIDTLDLAVITQNFDSTHTQAISTTGTVTATPASYTYESTQNGTIVMHQYTYHFEEIDMTSPMYGSSLSFDYSEFESVIGIEVDEASISPDVNVLFVHNDTTNRDFHVVNQLLDIDEYDMKIVVCEDVASLIQPDGTINSRSGNAAPILKLNDRIVVDSDGEKFKVETETDTIVNVNVLDETLNTIELFSNPINSGDPITLHSDIGTKAQIQFIDIKGQILHQFTRQLQTGTNTLNDVSTNLPKGVYFIQIIDTNNRFYTYKMMII